LNARKGVSVRQFQAERGAEGERKKKWELGIDNREKGSEGNEKRAQGECVV